MGVRARLRSLVRDIGPPDPDRTVAGLLAGRPAPRVAVVADRPDAVLPELREAVRLGTDLDRNALHTELAARGRFDLVVIDTADTPLRNRLVVDLLLHTRTGRHLVVHGVEADADDPAGTRAWLDRLQRGASAKGDLPKGMVALAETVREVRYLPGHAVVTNGRRAFAKLNEKQVNVVLQRRGGGRVIDMLPGVAQVRPRSELRESDSARAGSYTQEWTAPDLFLREYDDVVCLRGQVALQRNVVLPDSYRRVGRPMSGNRYLADRGPLFAVPRRKRLPGEVTEGTYFYWDSEFRGHFGHATTEQLSRMWAYARAREEHPDLRVLMAINKGRELAGFEVDILAAFGVRREEILFARSPVRVERLVAATPMFCQPNFVHPGITDVWDTLGAHLEAAAPDGDYPERFFVARRTGKRRCHNAVEVEALFARHGFAILHPEELSLAGQARLFRGASVIAGYAGSGLFNALLVDEPKHLIMVSSESYTAQNEWMIAATRGHRVDVAWCVPDVPMPPNRWVKEAFHSPYTFDFEREGRFVEDILAGL